MTVLCRALALAGAMSLSLASAHAQSFPPGYVQGNSTASAAPARASDIRAVLQRALGCSDGQVLSIAGGTIACISLGTGIATFLAAPSSANLAAAVTDETGSGALVFSNSPTLTTPNLGTPSALTLTNATGLPTSGLVDDAVTNAKLANMAQSTVKGRAAGAGTGDPTDLSAAQATAILDAMVGDSGTGGTKGLVPAPAAGDAAGGKFLKADGTWAVPAGGGGGGGMTDAERQNASLDRGYQAKVYGSPRRGIHTWADGYATTGGINSGSSSLYQVDTTNKYAYPTSTGANALLHFDGADASTTVTDSGSSSYTWSAFGNAQLDTAAFKFGSASLLLDGTGDYIRSTSVTSLGAGSWTINVHVRWNSLPASGTRQQIARVVTSLGASAAVGLWLDNTGGTIRPFWGLSSAGASYDIRTPAIGTRTTWSTGTWYHFELTFDGSTYRLFVEGTLDSSTTSSTAVAGSLSGVYFGADDTAAAPLNGWMDEIRIVIGTAAHTANFTAPSTAYSLTPANMTLVTDAQTADSSVSNGRVLMEINPVDSITLNTDLTAEVTCNGGSNWAAATLSSFGTGQSGRTVVETADTACTAGTSFAARLKTLNNKNVQIHGTSLTVH